MIEIHPKPADLSTAPGVSWWHVIVALEHRGYSPSSIAAAIGVSRGAVDSWKNRFIEPSYESGERLVTLWSAVHAVKRDEVPRRDKGVLSAASVR